MITRYQTDVLVVGGGGAATAATISAHEGGARTMLAVKGRFGVPGVRGSGATSNPIGDFWVIRTVGPKGGFFNPPEMVYQDMLQTGLGMADPAHCRVFVDEVSEAVNRLHSMGMQFKSKMLATMPADTNEGKTNNIVAIQKAVIEGTNTQVLEHANLTDIIVENGECRGAVGVDDAGEPFIVEAGAVVLATGGVGQLFQYSFNPPGNTGDGYAMALRAGAELFNMEFMQQGLATTWPSQGIVMLYEMEEPYRVRNASGKDFVGDYLPPGVTLAEVSKAKAGHWPVSCRDSALHLDAAIKAEVLAGRGTPNDAVFLDLSGQERKYEPELFAKFMLSKGVDIQKDLVQVTIHHHTSNGGIRIDTDGHTKVSGLFAVGEAGGWQGADRLGGTMLGGSQVFGWRAGRAAAAIARGGAGDAVPAALLDPLLEPLSRFKATKGRTRPDDLKPILQRTMWETLLVDKDATSLARARQCVDDQRAQLKDDLQIAEPFDCALAFEHRNLLDVAEAIIGAATKRTESRGSHIRSDYPNRDDENWMTNIIATHDQGQLVLERRWINEEVGWTDQPGDVRISPWG